MQQILTTAILVGLLHACIAFYFDGVVLSRGNFPNILWTNNIWRNLQKLAPKPFACSLCLITWLTLIRWVVGVLVASYAFSVTFLSSDYATILLSIPVTFAASLFLLSWVGINDIH